MSCVPGRLAALALLGGFSLLATTQRAAAGSNLILNSGNDEPLVLGEIPGWVEATGTEWTQRSDNPKPQAGTAYFFAGSVPLAELWQDVDVSSLAAAIDAGQQAFAFSGHVRSFPQSPMDSSRIVLEYRDELGGVRESWDSGEVTIAGYWPELADARTAPAGTRTVRVRLIAKRYAGSNNDGYFDSLELVATEPGPWADLGLGLGGTAGVPALAGSGGLVAGSAGALDLSDAASLAPTIVFVSLSSTPMPFKGGILAAVPVAFEMPVSTFLAGTWSLSWSAWPDGIPAGFELYLQVAVVDAGAVQGVAMSNLLRATQP